MKVFEIEKLLKEMDNYGLVEFENSSGMIRVEMLEPREDDRTINSKNKLIDKLNSNKIRHSVAILNYINKNKCRSQLLLNYFGEELSENCGICDHCLGLRKMAKTDVFEIKSAIINKLTDKSMDSMELVKELNISDEKVLYVLEELIDNKKIRITDSNQFEIII